MKSNLQEALRKKGITIKEYAEFLGISEKSVNNKLSGKTDFRYREFLKTCSLLFPEYNSQYLFDDSPPHKMA